MPKSKPIQISIPNPCHQSWDEMIPQGQGRHCAHCQKVVTDFTNWADAALYEFFIKNTGKAICGRFQKEQLNRDIIPYQPYSMLYRCFIGLGLVLVLGSTVNAQAQKCFSEKNGTAEIAGRVIVEEGWVAGTKVFLVKDNFGCYIIPDTNGYFSFDKLKPGDYRLLVVSTSTYKMPPTQDITLKEGEKVDIIQTLEANNLDYELPTTAITGIIEVPPISPDTTSR